MLFDLLLFLFGNHSLLFLLISQSFAHIVCTFRINNSRVNSFFEAELVWRWVRFIYTAIWIFYYFVLFFVLLFYSSCFSNLLTLNVYTEQHSIHTLTYWLFLTIVSTICWIASENLGTFILCVRWFIHSFIQFWVLQHYANFVCILIHES